MSRCERGQSDQAAHESRRVSVPFEPGSVFKVITLSAALETTNLRPESPINCNGGVLRLPGRTIHDSHAGIWRGPDGDRAAPSRATSARSRSGFTRGPAEHVRLHAALRLRTEDRLPLPGESPGKVRKLESWGTTSLASVAMGQEVSVTTVQLAQAASVVANGGMLVRPRLVLKSGDQHGARRAAGPRAQAGDGDHDAPDDGRRGAHRHRQPGAPAGYSSGGKTGSAQIYDYATKHYTHTYNGSFMGFAPITNPQVVVVVTLNGTHGEAGFGGRPRRRCSRSWPPKRCASSKCPRTCRRTCRTPTLVAKNAEDLNDLAIADLEPRARTSWKSRSDEDDVPTRLRR